MSIVWEIWNAIHAIIIGAVADPITLGIMIVVVLGAGFMMQGMESLLNATLIALLAFALLGYVRMVTLNKQPAGAYAVTDWHSFATTPALTLLSYALIFALGIAIVNTVRSLVMR